MDTIVANAAGRPFVVFDHGCGDGGDWPAVLADHPNLQLRAWDPDPVRATIIRHRLRGCGNAQVLAPLDVRAGGITADAIVSFSVLEHVRDRPAYLATAKRLLAPDGTFYLNYDGGHVRATVDPADPRTWGDGPRALRRLAAGRAGPAQHRVPRAEVDRLVHEAGFAVTGVRYENVEAWKALAKHVADRAAFARLWLAVEDGL